MGISHVPKVYRVWEFKTYRKFTEELYEVYEIVMLNVWLHVRVVNFRSVLYYNCLMLPYNVYKLLFSQCLEQSKNIGNSCPLDFFFIFCCLQIAIPKY